MGNLFSARVTIGANSATVLATGFGPACQAFSCNVRLTLPGSLSSLSASSFRLSNFVAQGGFAFYTALGEVEVLGRIAGGVPEPASWAMLIAGFGMVGSAARRRWLNIGPMTVRSGRQRSPFSVRNAPCAGVPVTMPLPPYRPLPALR